MKTNKSISRVLAVLLIMLSSSYAFSQDEEVAVKESTTEEPSKWKFGMGFGMNFVGGTNLSLSPNLTYNVSDKVAFGGGLQWNYASIKDVRKTSTIGGNLLAFYYPNKTILTLLEFQELNVNTKVETEAGEVKDSSWESALFLCLYECNNPVCKYFFLVKNLRKLLV